MDTKKTQELLYDIQGKTLQQSHDLIMEYVSLQLQIFVNANTSAKLAQEPAVMMNEEHAVMNEEYAIELRSEETQTEIIANNLSIDLYKKGDPIVVVRIKLEIPIKLMKSKFWTIENVLAQ